MKRLTTDEPRGNAENVLNLFFVKGGEVYVRGYGAPERQQGNVYRNTDLSLSNLTRLVADALGVQLDADTDAQIAEAMSDMLFYGPGDPEGVLALLYTAATTSAELRARLKQYEDMKEVIAHGKAAAR